MNEGHPLGDPAELAALYVAGAMNHIECWAFERHMSDGCDRCASELRQLNAASTSLAEFCDDVQPAEWIRKSLMQRIAASGPAHADDPDRDTTEQVWRKWKGDSAVQLCTLRANEGGWEATGVEGVSIRRLFVDSKRNQFTGMVRMTPGATYPRHVHNGAEECLVLEGDLHVGDLVLHAGDYQRAPAGSLHGVQSTEGGCLLLITSSLTDDFV